MTTPNSCRSRTLHLVCVGTVEVGKRADLVLVAGDPTRDVGAFWATRLVSKDGVGYDSERLFASVKGWVGVR